MDELKKKAKDSLFDLEIELKEKTSNEFDYSFIRESFNDINRTIDYLIELSE